jgi:hypothetical protein
MQISFVPCAIQKAGNGPDEYEDAFFPRERRRFEALYFRTALADGAGETSFAGEWARDLVEGYCRRRFDETRVAATIGRLQGRWRARLAGRQLPWYAEEKLRWGAFSSLLGLTVFDGRCGDRPGGCWTAVAAGDSCLFHLRQGVILESFPLESAGDFTVRPHLISSLPAGNGALSGITRFRRGSWRNGDRLILTTDAAAQSLMRGYENGTDGFSELLEVAESPDGFVAWVGELRESKRMRNDDVTVAIVELGSAVA